MNTGEEGRQIFPNLLTSQTREKNPQSFKHLFIGVGAMYHEKKMLSLPVFFNIVTFPDIPIYEAVE